jgi:hypothetical protein
MNLEKLDTLRYWLSIDKQQYTCKPKFRILFLDFFLSIIN